MLSLLSLSSAENQLNSTRADEASGAFGGGSAAVWSWYSGLALQRGGGAVAPSLQLAQEEPFLEEWHAMAQRVQI